MRALAHRIAASTPLEVVLVVVTSIAAAAAIIVASAVPTALLAGVAATAGVALIAWRACGRAPAWARLVLICLAGYIAIARGFAYLAPIPFAPWLFMGEIVIVSGLLLLPHRSVAYDFWREPIGKVAACWALYGGVHLAAAAPTMEFTAAKATCLVYYVAFVYFGFAAARLSSVRRQLPLILGLTFIAHVAHSWLSFSDAVVAASPEIYDGISLLGIASGGMPYINTVGAGFFFLLFARSSAARLAGMAAAFFLLFFIQSRTGFIAAGLSAAVFAVSQPFGRVWRAASQLGLLLVAGLLLLALIEGQFTGHKGPVSTRFVLTQLASIVGAAPRHEMLEYDSLLMGPREGRLEIWTGLVEDTWRSGNSVFGQGFSRPLLEHPLANGSVKRSPHNTFVAVFGYLGAIGVVLFCAMLAAAILPTIRTIRRAAAKPQTDGFLLLVWCLVYTAANLVGSLFGVIWDSPVHAAPAYFVMGLSVGLVTLLRPSDQMVLQS